MCSAPDEQSEALVVLGLFKAPIIPLFLHPFKALLISILKTQNLLHVSDLEKYDTTLCSLLNNVTNTPFQNKKA